MDLRTFALYSYYDMVFLDIGREVPSELPSFVYAKCEFRVMYKSGNMADKMVEEGQAVFILVRWQHF